MDNNLSVLEGLLFLCGNEGISNKEIMNVLEIDEDELVKLIEEFNKTLNNNYRGLELSIINNRYRLITKKEHFDYYAKLVDNPINFTFSNAALETLAIIAYNQPVTRLEVEKIRGVNSDSIVRKLLAKSLIKEAGRKDSIGQPMLYEVTNEFLDYFNLNDLKELPELNEEIEEEDKNIYSTKFAEETD